MDKLFQYSALLSNRVSSAFQRSLMEKINWSHQLIAITGDRGVGKSTLLLQHLRLHLKNKQALYVTLDDIYFKENSLFDLAEQFHLQEGGEVLLLDEVHKYGNWSQEIKNIYDLLPDLQIVFTGSSILAIDKAEYDLSRRAVTYYLPNLSFREFLSYRYNISLEPVSFNDLLSNAPALTEAWTAAIGKPLPYFKQYLEYGQYPYFKKYQDVFPIQLSKTINLVLESDLPAIIPIDRGTVEKAKQLLFILAESVPFKPNIQKLSERLHVSRNTLLDLLYYLHRAGLIINLRSQTKGVSHLSKPKRILLGNTNISYALSTQTPEQGTLRETFAANQFLSAGYDISYPKDGDLQVGDQIIEIGGKRKSDKQLKGNRGIVAADDILIASRSKIPLWAFGMMY